MRNFLKEEFSVKSKRHVKILQLIKDNDIYTQEDLLNLLYKDGYEVTQATVSRDIKDLKLIKIQSSNGKYKYASSLEHGKNENLDYLTLFKDSIVDLNCAMNTVVIKCTPGMAQAVCVAIDSLEFNQIVGTIAGDDTIFALTQSEKKALMLIGSLQKLLH